MRITHLMYLRHFQQGNSDGNTPVENQINGGIRAKFVRLNVLAWQGFSALRWELFGCAGKRSFFDYVLKHCLGVTNSIGHLQVSV